MSNQIVRFFVVLFLISAVSAGLLGWVNYITAPVIARRAAEEAARARKEVLPDADSFLAVSEDILAKLKERYPLIKEVYAGLKDRDMAGFVFTVNPKGYSSEIVTMIGMTRDGINMVRIISQGETPGVGTKITDGNNPDDFMGEKNLKRLQSSGLSRELALSKDGGSIQAVTGATVSSRAVMSGINAARDAFKWILDNYQDPADIIPKDNRTAEAEGGGNP
ncbi:MAG: RnfABCDGE type electron transport complex subunit G [Bacillota bacterium]